MRSEVSALGVKNNNLQEIIKEDNKYFMIEKNEKVVV